MNRMMIPTFMVAAWTVSGPYASAQIVEENVTFDNGSARLAGTLLLPQDDGPHPALVFLHGSGPHPREIVRPYAEAFTSLGIACLIFDKRGSGESTGNWVSSSLEDLARDAVAALELVKSRPEVDATRVGLWAPSQGAWVASLASNFTADIGFLIVLSGGGVTPLESEIYSYEKDFEAGGVTEAQKEEARKLLSRYFAYLETGDGREQLVRSIDVARDEPWYQFAPLGKIVPSEENRPSWEWVATFDPAPYISQMRFPILLLFGDRDREQPTEIAVRKWKKGLEQAGNRDVDIRIFPGANHLLRVDDPHAAASHHQGLSDESLETVTEWLRAHVVR